jgi:hypothetical protein
MRRDICPLSPHRLGWVLVMALSELEAHNMSSFSWTAGAGMSARFFPFSLSL